MPSLIGADAGSGVNVAANYLKTSPSTQFGTRQLKFVKVVASGGSVPDLTTADGSSGSYTASNSLFSKAVRTLQNYVELYAVGTPTATAFTIVIALDTGNSSDSGNGTNAMATTWGLAEAEVLAALGSWGSGVVTMTSMDLSGITLA